MDKNTNSTFCSYFWKHLCVRPDNLVKPCCRFETVGDESLVLKEDVSEVINSPALQELRANALAGQPNSGCQKCYQQEEQGVFSLRQFANESYPIKDDPGTQSMPEDIEYLEYFLGDNCNLKCVTCRPQLSTKWRQDYKKLGWALEQRVERHDPFKFLKQFPNLKEVKLVGGEPFVDPDHENALTALLKFQPSKIKLIYFTNGTVFPQSNLLEIWNQFKEVEIFFSVDGVGEVNDYIRFPSKWGKVDQVIDRFLQMGFNNKRFTFQFATTVSILNIWSLKEIEEWYESKIEHYPDSQILGLTLNPLIKPSHLSIRALPLSIQKELVEGSLPVSSRIQRVHRWMNQRDEQEDIERAKTYLDQLDRVRSVSWQTSLPQLQQCFQST